MATKFLDVNRQVIDAIFALDDVGDIDNVLDSIVDDYGIEKIDKKAAKKPAKSKDNVISLEEKKSAKKKGKEKEEVRIIKVRRL